MAPEAVSMERVYHSLKAQILAGAFPMGVRIEVKAVAFDHGTSVTPVRDAIHRLIGERLVEMQSHGGFQLPIMTEPALRDLYNWNLNLALIAVQNRPPTRSGIFARVVRETATSPRQNHIADATASLFELLATWSGNREQHDAVSRVNDRLHRARRVETHFIRDGQRELRRMARQIDSSHGDEVIGLLTTYHHRRMDHVAEIIRVMHER